MQKKVAVLSLLLFAASTPGQEKGPPTAEEFRKQIAELFDYDSTKLAEEELEARGERINEFLDHMAENKAAYLPLVRAELKRESGVPSVFRMCAGLVVIQNSERTEDMDLALASLARCDLTNLSKRYYFGVVHAGACKGGNALACMQLMLDTPKFEAYLVEHVFTLDKGLTTLYCTLCSDQKVWFDAFVKRLATEKEPDVARALLISLYETVSPAALDAIKRYAESDAPEQPRKLAKSLAERGYAAELPKVELTARREKLFDFLTAYLDRNYDVDGIDFELYSEQAVHLVQKGDYDRLVKMRREHAERVSDEALDEIMFMSRLIRRAFVLANEK